MWQDDDDIPDIHPEVDPFMWFRSSFGNAYFSGITYEQLWSAVQMSETPEQLDAAISSIENLNKIVYPSLEGDSHENCTPTPYTPEVSGERAFGLLRRVHRGGKGN